MVAETAEHHLTLRQRVITEAQQGAILTAYLYVIFAVIIAYKTAVLRDQGIGFVPWGIAIVKAAVLAKFVLIGRAMKLGERNLGKPLIWPTLYQALVFTALLVVLTIIEEIVVGLFHGKEPLGVLAAFFGPRLPEFAAATVIVLLALAPYFAIHLLSERLGEGRLTRMFFVDRHG